MRLCCAWLPGESASSANLRLTSPSPANHGLGNSLFLASSTLTICLNQSRPNTVPRDVDWRPDKPLLITPRLGGEFDLGGLSRRDTTEPLLLIQLPLPFLVILLLPIAFGTLRGFRFPLWTWFAWTALLACQLAMSFSR